MGDHALRKKTLERGSRYFGIRAQARYTKTIIVMKLDDQRYTADLMFDDAAFCKQIYELLQRNIGRSIEEIGDLDVSGTL
jgi:hypothetical protein